MSPIKNQLINQKSINQLIWASCGLNQSARSIIGHGGPRRASVLVLVGASLILPAGGCEWPPNRPARPPHQLALSLFFFAAKESKIGAGAEVIGLVLDCKTITQLTLDAR